VWCGEMAQIGHLEGFAEQLVPLYVGNYRVAHEMSYH